MHLLTTTELIAQLTDLGISPSVIDLMAERWPEELRPAGWKGTWRLWDPGAAEIVRKLDKRLKRRRPRKGLKSSNTSIERQ